MNSICKTQIKRSGNRVQTVSGSFFSGDFGSSLPEALFLFITSVLSSAQMAVTLSEIDGTEEIKDPVNEFQEEAYHSCKDEVMVGTAVFADAAL